jgi:hypothetical protein
VPTSDGGVRTSDGGGGVTSWLRTSEFKGVTRLDKSIFKLRYKDTGGFGLYRTGEALHKSIT